jgi:hypothetical protein
VPVEKCTGFQPDGFAGVDEVIGPERAVAVCLLGSPPLTLL